MRNQLRVTALACLMMVPAFAQVGGPGPGGMGPGGMGPHGMGPHGIGPGAGPGLGMHHGKIVTGAPYSATVTNTVVQTLTGGNTIQRATTGQVARDSQGRIFEQQTVTAGPLAESGPKKVTFLFDPVAGYSYVLNAATKTANRRPIHNSASAGEPGKERFDGGRRHEGSDSTNVAAADLGTDASSGVSAQGKEITRTIPAGAIGNTQPIVSTSQTWTSPELQVIVKAIRNDPRFGQSTYALSNVVQKEPDASLFQVPSDYTVKDAPQHGPHEGPPPAGVQ